VNAKLIVNPSSGGEAAPDHLTLMNRRIRERAGSLDIVLTTGEGDAFEAARRAVTDGCDHLFVAGGDGTLNETLNGAARAYGGLSAVTFGVIPLGTGNDFANALGLPEDVERALEMLLEGAPIPVDVGRLNDDYFVNVSGGGFIADVSDAVTPHLKTIAGKLAYLIGGAQVLLNYEPVATRVRNLRPGVPIGLAQARRPAPGDAPMDLDLYAFAVCNAWSVGGGRLIAPHARIDDGELDVCLIEAMPTIDFLNLLRRVSNGEHVADDRVWYFRTRELELAFERVIKINTDGEVLEADRCRYRALPRGTRFLADRAAARILGDPGEDDA
jgi:diacylglycerol kinase (ATP)